MSQKNYIKIFSWFLLSAVTIILMFWPLDFFPITPQGFYFFLYPLMLLFPGLSFSAILYLIRKIKYSEKPTTKQVCFITLIFPLASLFVGFTFGVAVPLCGAFGAYLICQILKIKSGYFMLNGFLSSTFGYILFLFIQSKISMGLGMASIIIVWQLTFLIQFCRVPTK